MSSRQQLKDFFDSTSPVPIHGFVSRLLAEALAKASSDDELKSDLTGRIVQLLATAPPELGEELRALLADLQKESLSSTDIGWDHKGLLTRSVSERSKARREQLVTWSKECQRRSARGAVPSSGGHSPAEATEGPDATQSADLTILSPENFELGKVIDYHRWLRLHGVDLLKSPIGTPKSSSSLHRYRMLWDTRRGVTRSGDAPDTDTFDGIGRVWLKDKTGGKEHTQTDELKYLQLSVEWVAWYQPFHFYSDSHWGVYFHADRLAEVVQKYASELGVSKSLVTSFIVSELRVHELLHARVEALASFSEVISPSERYLSRSDDLDVFREEEAAATYLGREAARTSLMERKVPEDTVIKKLLDKRKESVEGLLGYGDWQEAEERGEFWTTLARKLLPASAAGRVPDDACSFLRGEINTLRFGEHQMTFTDADIPCYFIADNGDEIEAIVADLGHR